MNPAPLPPVSPETPAEPVPAAERLDYLLWQLADSAFPTGGFAHSNGLEAAWQHGEVRGRSDLLAFAENSLDQQGHAGLPFVLATFGAPATLAEVDAFCEAFLSNHVANRASRLQGRALGSAMERIFKPHFEASPLVTPHGHYAPLLGACLQRLEVPRETVIRLFFFNHLRSVLAAAVRLNIVGPMEAQQLQYKLSATAAKIGRECAAFGLEEVAQTAPLLDLWQGAQDRLYSRLFQS